jgi:hypothetical protein
MLAPSCRELKLPRLWDVPRNTASLVLVIPARLVKMCVLMKSKIALAIALLISGPPVRAEKIALINGTMINPGHSQIVQNATIIIDGDKIAATDDAKTISAAKDARTIDCKGKFILPGYIDTHVHFFQSGDLFTRPDGADLNSVRPYKEEIAWVKSHLNDVFALSAQWNHLGG